MKLKKLSIDALSDKTRLSEQQMNGYVGGYSYDNNHCFYNCMEYIGKEVYGSYSYNYKFYGCAYVNGYASYSGSRNDADFNDGPELFGIDGKLNGSIANFIGAVFSSASTSFATGCGAADLFKYGSNDGVVGFFITGSNMAHAVILTGYDRQTDTYSYYDPSSMIQGSNQRIKASNLCGAIDCKQ